MAGKIQTLAILFQRMLKEYGRDLNNGTRAISGQGSSALRIHILPLYGSLPYHEQMRVFERTPKNHRKVVVSTNVAGEKFRESNEMETC